jgi:hypothetical protein
LDAVTDAPNNLFDPDAIAALTKRAEIAANAARRPLSARERQRILDQFHERQTILAQFKATAHQRYVDYLERSKTEQELAEFLAKPANDQQELAEHRCPGVTADEANAIFNQHFTADDCLVRAQQRADSELDHKMLMREVGRDQPSKWKGYALAIGVLWVIAMVLKGMGVFVVSTD